MRLDSKPRRTPSRQSIAIIFSAIIFVGIALWFFINPIRNAVDFAWGKARGGYSVPERMAQYGHAVEVRLIPAFASAGLSYPAKQLVLWRLKTRSA